MFSGCLWLLCLLVPRGFCKSLQLKTFPHQLFVACLCGCEHTGTEPRLSPFTLFRMRSLLRFLMASHLYIMALFNLCSLPVASYPPWCSTLPSHCSDPLSCLHPTCLNWSLKLTASKTLPSPHPPTPSFSAQLSPFPELKIPVDFPGYIVSHKWCDGA